MYNTLIENLKKREKIFMRTYSFFKLDGDHLFNMNKKKILKP